MTNCEHEGYNAIGSAFHTFFAPLHPSNQDFAWGVDGTKVWIE